MNVDAAIFWQIEDGWTENLPEGGDNDQIRCPTMQILECIRFRQPVRLDHRQVELLCQVFYRRWHQDSAATSRPVRLGDNPNYLVFSSQSA